MSPFPIHEQGGLTEAEIKLAIEEAAERREAALDTKLSLHRDEIAKRMDRTENCMKDNNDKLAGLQTTVAVISDVNGRQTEILEKMSAQGEQWHADDLKFREDVIGRVSKIESDQVILTVQVKKLRLIGAALNATGKCVKFVAVKLSEADFWRVLGTIVILYLLHLLAPQLFSLIHEMVK